MRFWSSICGSLIDSLSGSRSLRGGMLALLVCVCATLLATEGWQLWRVRQTSEQQADVVMANTARSLAEQADAMIKTADTVVASLVQRVEADGTGPEARVRFHGLMTSLAAALPAIHEMGITDTHGNAIVKSMVENPTGLNYAEREYFKFHATHDDPGAFIGERVKSKIDGSYNITVSRRIDRADDSFGGVVVTSVSLEYFQDLFDQIQAKSGGIIALVADDKTILIRSPAVVTHGALSASRFWQQLIPNTGQGITTYVSDVDGVRRHGAYYRLPHYPMSVMVSQSVWDIEAGWRSELRTHAIILGCFLIVVAFVGRRALQANRMLNAQATQDGLTGLANRRAFDQTIAREFRRSARSGLPVSVAMIDLDQFKSYNDHYGHPAGDACLRAVAGAVQGCVRREGEFAARYGGEEIAVILPGYDKSRASDLAETIRVAVRSLAVPHALNTHGIVTLSVGVATSMPGVGVNAWPDLIEDADTALYAAKESGRDKVMTYPPMPSALHGRIQPVRRQLTVGPM